jgi:hypothetical protein
MNKIIIAFAVIIIFGILNYALFPLISTTSTSTMNEVNNLALVSYNDHYNHHSFAGLEIFGMGYALIALTLASYNIWLTYYDFNHNLFWNRNLNITDFNEYEVTGSEKYISIYHRSGSYFHPTRGGVEIYDRYPQALIFDVHGDIISNFGIQLVNATENVQLSYSSMSTEILSSEIYEDTIYFLESTKYGLLNDTYTSVCSLHSYDINSGELHWIEQIDLINHHKNSSIDLNSFEHLQLIKDEQSIIFFTTRDRMLLYKHTIQFDDTGRITFNNREINSFDCLNYCMNTRVLTFNEIIDYTKNSDAEKTVHTFTSSKGYSLDITVAPRILPDSDWIVGSDLNFHQDYKINAKTIALGGDFRSNEDYHNNVLGFLSSNNKLDLKLMDMNQTRIDLIRAIDDNTFLSTLSNVPSKTYQVVIWSINRFQMIDNFYPIEKNYLPVIMVLSIIVYYISRGINNLKPRFKPKESDN